MLVGRIKTTVSVPNVGPVPHQWVILRVGMLELERVLQHVNDHAYCGPCSLHTRVLERNRFTAGSVILNTFQEHVMLTGHWLCSHASTTA